MASYTYDYKGRRVSKTAYDSPDAITKYLYDGAQVIEEYNSSGTLRRFFYGPGIDEPIMMIDYTAGNKMYYYHYDGLGSVVALSDSSGNIVEKYEYDVFGEPNRTSSVGNPYMFTGRCYEPETGLYYYRARYYDPYIGRFLQTDPIGYYDSMNLYVYCLNSPANYIDPYGESRLARRIRRDIRPLFYSHYSPRCKGNLSCGANLMRTVNIARNIVGRMTFGRVFYSGYYGGHAQVINQLKTQLAECMKHVKTTCKRPAKCAGVVVAIIIIKKLIAVILIAIPDPVTTVVGVGLVATP